MHKHLDVSAVFPNDYRRAVLIGRVWMEGTGAVLVHVRDNGIYDLSSIAATCSELMALPDPASVVRKSIAGQVPLARTPAVLANSAHDKRSKDIPWFLAPCDLQAIKAAGATFVASRLEQVIEAQAIADAGKAEKLRSAIAALIGDDLSRVQPGSPTAEKLKAVLMEHGVWSQHLEVAIGPDAEIFTKSQPMSAVGLGAEVGIHPRSIWNNPEPEVVLAINRWGQVKGVALGNDVNLRDFEARSAHLMGRAKDNNASCAIGPFIRLFDEDFRLEDMRDFDVSVEVTGMGSAQGGEAAYTMSDTSSMRHISRDPIDLVRQTIGDNHQYPDGLMLFLGTMFAPIQDRFEPGQGFTHRAGDLVRISAPQIGSLINQVNRSDKIAPWSYGIRALMRDLARRGALA